MKESITSRINNLRTYMKAHGLAAYICLLYTSDAADE